MIFNTQRFKEKLQKKGYAKSSIESYIRRVELYKDWCKQKNKTKIESDKKLAFLYLKFLKKQTSNYRTINRELQPLRLYCKLFKKDNPFRHLYIKKVEEKIKPNFFSKEELEDIYNSYPQNSIYEIRDKILLGFYLFQGVKSSEAKIIEITDIDLSGYKILLKGDKRTNIRKIGLDIKQILLLNEYVNYHRKKLLWSVYLCCDDFIECINIYTRLWQRNMITSLR